MRTLLLALLLLAAGGCDSTDNPLIAINVALINDTLTRTHLMHASESFAPSNQVVSNEQRTVRIEILDPGHGGGSEGTAQVFRAGRNGQVLSTVTCRASRTTAEDNYQVVLNRDETMTCQNW